jgi:8-amino-7-oxononanoate synthase
MLSCALAASLALIRDEPGRRAHLFALINRWREAAAALPWQTLPSTTAIQPLILGANADALRISDALWKRDIWVPATRPPTVPRGSARLRITFPVSHTIDDVDRLAEALSDVAR